MELVILIISIISAVIAGLITKSKNRSFFAGFMIGAFALFFGIIVALMTSKAEE